MKRLDHYWYSQNPIAWLLLPLSGLYCLISSLRRGLYRRGLLASYQPPVPLIVVGNISVGGTGKTPLLVELCRQLKAQGYRPGLISRGYGGQASHWPQAVDPQSLASEVGDEPVLLVLRTACPMVVGPDRRADVEQLLADHDCNIILSDDGLQHYRLKRHAEIAVIDASRQFGNGFCLPSGPLREPVHRLASVSMAIVNGGQRSQLSFSIKAGQCVSLQTDGADCELSEFQGKTVHAVAGIGNPQRFFNMLRQQGIEVIAHAFADHYAYKAQDLQFNDALPVLMTEKDAVKCRNFNLQHHWYLPIDVELSEPAQNRFNLIVQQVCHG